MKEWIWKRERRSLYKQWKAGMITKQTYFKSVKELDARHERERENREPEEEDFV